MSSKEFELQDKAGGGAHQPTSMLGVYMHAIQSPLGDDFLDQSSLGLGNYNSKEYWLQIQSFRHGLYADAALTRRVLERAIHEAKRKLARDCYNRPDQMMVAFPQPNKPEDDEFGDDYETEEEYIERAADQIWDDLGTEDMTTVDHQVMMIEKYAGIDKNWVPPHWRMLKMRHEASRSKGARLIDNLFERIREVKDTTMESTGLE